MRPFNLVVSVYHGLLCFFVFCEDVECKGLYRVFLFLSFMFLDMFVLKIILTVNAEPSCVSADDGSSHLQASLEAHSIVKALTACRTYSIVFSTYVNRDAGAVL